MPDNEQCVVEKKQAPAGDSGGANDTVNAREPSPEATARLERIEKLLRDMRGALDAAARAGEHREYSLGRLTGSVLQVIVGGLVALALLDWLLAAPAGALLIKLAFAAVLQLSALTAFVVSRRNR